MFDFSGGDAARQFILSPEFAQSGMPVVTASIGDVIWYALPLITGYLLGSIPFGLVLTRFAGLGDIRDVGSGNIGATNVLRTGNKFLAALTLLFDLLKGTLAVILGYELGSIFALGAAGALLGGAGAFLGHLFPVWLNFRGGKGVATYIGVMLGLSWVAAVVFSASWLITAVLTRYSSLSALVASVVTPVAALLLDRPGPALLAALLTPLLIWKHSANIQRLLAGEEPKIGDKK